MNIDTVMNLVVDSKDYQIVGKTLKYLKDNYKRNPSRKDIASLARTSEYSLQQVFERWAGVKPERFMQCLSRENLREALSKSESYLENSNEFSGSARFYHKKFLTVKTIDLKTHFDALEVKYGIHDSPFGKCLLAVLDSSICYLSFVMDRDIKSSLSLLRNRWETMNLVKDESIILPFLRRIFGYEKKGDIKCLSLLLIGTDFQVRVWRALLKIQAGRLFSYEDVAKIINSPKSVRAVANAVANNPIAFIIPCHRVVRKTGEIHNYRWGIERKMAMIGWEANRLKT